MAAFDTFAARESALTQPASTAEAVVPHDTNELVNVSRAVYVGVAGDLTVVMQNGTTPVLFKNAAVGYHALRVKKVMATGTTATNIVAVS